MIKKRATDKWYIRHAAKIHILTAFFVGRISMEFIPKWYFVKLFGEGWKEFLSTIEILGGLPVIGSFALVIFQIYKWKKERKK